MVKTNTFEAKHFSSYDMEDSTDSIIDVPLENTPMKLHKHPTEAFDKFKDGLQSKHLNDALETCQKLSSHLSSNGTSGLGQDQNIHTLIRLAIDVPHEAGIECAYQLSEYVGSQDNDQFLREIFCSVGQMEPPSGTFKNPKAQIDCYLKYAHFLRSIESKLQPDKSIMMGIWHKLLKDPNLYHATILSVLNQLEFVSLMSQKEVTDFLKQLTDFLLKFTKMKLKRKKTIAHKLARCFRLIIGSVFLDDEIVKDGKLTKQLVALAKACTGKVRQPWITVNEDTNSDVEDDIYGSDGEQGNEDDTAESSKNRLLFTNINVYEGCLHEIFRSVRCSGMAPGGGGEGATSAQDAALEEMKVAILEATIAFIKDRIAICTDKQQQSTATCAPMVKQCDCSMDLLTEACAAALIEFYAIYHADKAYDHSTAIQAYIKAHHRPKYLTAVARLYPYRGNSFKTLFNELFTFGKEHCSFELLALIEAAALYDRDTVQSDHIDFVDTLLMQAHDPDDIFAALKVLTAAAETNPGELMQERGEGYYGVVSRISNKDEQAQAISEINIILRYIAMSDRSEAVRIMDLYKTNLERHPNDILRCILYISMFQADVVERHRPWIEECARVEHTRAQANSVLEVLKGKMMGDSDEIGKNPKSSSFCNIQ